MVKKALIIAAGNGSRLSRGHKDTPKPLRKVGGIPLIKRIILTAKQAGLTEFVIVVGYQKERVMEAVRSYDLGVKIEFIENDDWQKSNGISVLAARERIHEDFVLLMSDHIFTAKTLQNLRRTPLGSNRALLAIDYKLGMIFDMDDATKVRVAPDGQIKAIDKQLQHFNAVDTGMFLCSSRLFSALEEASVNGDCSLSDGIRLLASRRQMGLFNIEGAYWQDVDTPAALNHAEKILLNDCRKASDGWVARHINRPISLWMTKYLIRTNMSANHMTGLTTLVGVASGIFAARGDYWNMLLGATLFQLASILDGVDGEMSRIKLTASRVGQWLDTISDNLSYVSFVTGLVIAVNRQASPVMNVVGLMTLIGVGLALLVLFSFLLRFTDSGSLRAIQEDLKRPTQESRIIRFTQKFLFAVRRDFFALLFLVLALFGQQDVILWLCCIGFNLIWIVMLNYRFGLFKSPITKEATE